MTTNIETMLNAVQGMSASDVLTIARAISEQKERLAKEIGEQKRAYLLSLAEWARANKPPVGVRLTVNHTTEGWQVVPTWGDERKLRPGRRPNGERDGRLLEPGTVRVFEYDDCAYELGFTVTNAVTVDGLEYPTISAAAKAIERHGRAVNGYDFFQKALK